MFIMLFSIEQSILAEETLVIHQICQVSLHTVCDRLENSSKSHIFISVYLSLLREKYCILNIS